jgi:ribosome maturation factor RimP
MDLKDIKDLIVEVISKYDDLFILDQNVSKENDIKIVIDGDRPINILDCKKINLELEKKIDEADVDASVQVTSPGVDEPLKVKRQYYKNIGRKLQIRTETQSYKASLETVSDDYIEIAWKSREKKTKGKGKVTVDKKQNVAFNDIIEAKVMINFNKK